MILSTNDGGLNWQPFNDGLIDGTFVMDISISPSNRKLRLATHGKGVFERDMLPITITGISEILQDTELEIGPNPAISSININIMGSSKVESLTSYDVKGNRVRVINKPENNSLINLDGIQSGKYFIVAEQGGKRIVKSFIKL